MIRFLSGMALGVLIALGINSWSEPYAGGSIGQAHQYGIGNDHIDRSACASYRMDRHSFATTLFAGYRYHAVGVEVGAGSLFHSTWDADCPPSKGSQDIKASEQHIRLNIYVPFIMGMEVVPFVGRARVRFTNFEEQNYRAPYFVPEHATNLTTGKQFSKFVGLGLEKHVGDFFGRVEFQKTDRVAEDYWTARGWHNSVQTVSASLGRYF